MWQTKRRQARTIHIAEWNSGAIASTGSVDHANSAVPDDIMDDENTLVERLLSSADGLDDSFCTALAPVARSRCSSQEAKEREPPASPLQTSVLTGASSLSGAVGGDRSIDSWRRNGFNLCGRSALASIVVGIHAANVWF